MNLLILNDTDFGYNLDYYYYCKYLSHDFKITYICFDRGYHRVVLNNVNVIYIKKEKKVSSHIKYFWIVITNLMLKQDIVMLKSYHLGWLLRILFPTKDFVYDIRSGSVLRNKCFRYFRDNILRFNALFFDNITVVSMNLAEKLKISREKIHILPLGADIISKRNKTFFDMNFIYIGTLQDRNLDVLIRGFYRFYLEFHILRKITFKIVGNGDRDGELAKLVKLLNLEHVITFEGFVPHDRLESYLDKANIGISFIPITDYYDIQPPTKTYEYLMSGLGVLASETKANIELINNNNGVLVKDTIIGVYEGLKILKANMEEFNSEIIRNSCSENTWENIVNQNLKKYFNRLKKRNELLN